MTPWSLQRHVIGSRLSKISLSFMERLSESNCCVFQCVIAKQGFFLLGGPLNQFLAEASFMTPLTLKYSEENALYLW